MKKVLLLTLAMMICASMAFAQAGGIGLYTDSPAYTSCTFTDAGAALVPIYVVHKLCPGATASQKPCPFGRRKRTGSSDPWLACRQARFSEGG